MQRGVLTISKDEFNQLIPVLNIEKFHGTQLYEKLNSALQNDSLEIKILLSEDEVERIIDEVGPPIYDNQLINSALQKITELMVSFRQ